MPTALMIAMVTVGGERQPSPPLVFSAAKEVLVGPCRFALRPDGRPVRVVPWDPNEGRT